MINIYKQIRAFYSNVFESDINLRPTHISLYMFLLNQNNRANWVEWFKCPFDTVMMGACINSNKTYYSVLNDLQEFKFIEYKKGINNYRAPRIKLLKLYEENKQKDIVPFPENDFSSVIFTQVNTLLNTQLSKQLSTQQCKQLDTHLSKQLSKHKDILLTDNYKLVINKIEDKILLSEIKISDVPDKDIDFYKIAIEFQKLFIQITEENDLSSKQLKSATYKKWVDPIRIAINQKEIKIDKLREIYTWIKKRETKQSKFWASNIRSTTKLREQISKIVMQMNNEKSSTFDQISKL